MTSQLFIQMRDVAIMVCSQGYQESHDMLISELRRFIVMIQMLVCAKLGVRIENFAYVRKRFTWFGSNVILESGVTFLKVICIKLQLMVDGLKIKVSDVPRCGL